MGLLDEIEQQKRRSGTGRLMDKILADLPKKDAADLRAALEGDASGGAIARALRARGIEVSAGCVEGYRRLMGGRR